MIIIKNSEVQIDIFPVCCRTDKEQWAFVNLTVPTAYIAHYESTHTIPEAKV